jgi:hypothetical protein
MKTLEATELAAFTGGTLPAEIDRLVYELYLAQLAEEPEPFRCAAHDMAQ